MEPLLLLILLAVPMVMSDPPKELASVDRFEKPPEKLNLLIVTMHGPYKPRASAGGDQPRQLTEKGRYLMKRVGSLLMMRYENHFKRLNPQLIQVTAIDKDIARTSAKELINGIEQQNQELAKKLQMTLSERTNIDKNKYFDPLRLRKQEEGLCKEFDKWAKKLKNPQKMSTGGFQGWFKHKTVEGEFQKFDRLQMEFLETRIQPDWTKGDSGKSALKAMRKDAITRMKNLIGGDVFHWKFFISNMLQNVFNEFKVPQEAGATRELKYQEPRLHIHVVDDHLMTALVWWLRLENSLSTAYLEGPNNFFYPQVGDSLLIEIDNDLYLKTSYIRAVEQLYSGVGFTTLSLKPKFEIDFGAASATILDPGKGGRTQSLKGQLFPDEDQYNRCCTYGFRRGDC